MKGLAAQLISAGMSEAEAQRKAEAFACLADVLSGATAAIFVPGRIEVLGKHTDYCGGRSLLCCAERGFCMLARARTDATLHLHDLGRGVTCDLPISNTTEAAAHWPNYAATVVRRLARNLAITRGADVAFASDLPSAAGMSSSSALMIAIFLALAHSNHLHDHELYRGNITGELDLATYLACIENGSGFRELEGSTGVGTFGGSEDHTAILCCRANEVAQFRFAPPTLERHIPFPDELIFAIASSGVEASKTGAAREHYNRLAREARALVEAANSALPGLQASTLAEATEFSLQGAERLRNSIASEELKRRLDQFVIENYEVMPQAPGAFARRDWRSFGALVERSQRAAEDLLQNQVPETILLVRAARELGAMAASAFGAGFGGSVWALVARDSADAFLNQWSARYRAEFPQRSSTFFLTRPGPAARLLAV